MNKLKLFGFLAVLVVIAGTLSSCKLKNNENETVWRQEKVIPARPVLDLQNAFVEASENVKPAVVNISATRIEKNEVFSYRSQSPFGQDSLDDFFKHFFSPEWEAKKYKSVGSGLIIDERGYVLTNFHVIERAKDIQITIDDGKTKKSYKGTVIGTDSRTDLSVIKIEGKGKFPVALLGDSDKIKVGEWSIAIGSPFGLEHTVTVGVISAKRQNVSIESRNYEDLIQTDASINPGNSGGPLVNIYGEVVGINVAIFSPTGSFVGVGFAIPINKAKEILEELIKKGSVRRGWLGVKVQEITPQMAKVFSLPSGSRGVLISDIVNLSPAEKGGLKRGDIIIKVNENNVSNSSDLQKAVFHLHPNSICSIKILRSGKEFTMKIKIGEVPLAENADSFIEEKNEKGIARLGMIVQNSEEGVIVSNVENGSVAQNAGIIDGDVVLEVNKKQIKNVADFEKMLKASQNNILFLLKRGETTIYIAVGT